MVMAWFTDQELFDALCKQSALGLRVTVIVLADEINQGPQGLNFQRLKDVSGEVYFIPADDSARP